MIDPITIITVIGVMVYIVIELKIIQPHRIKKLMMEKKEWILKIRIKTKCLSKDLALKIPYCECIGCSELYEIHNNVGELEKCSCGMKWRLTEIKDWNAIIKVGE